MTYIFSQEVIDDLKRSVSTGKAIRGPFDVQILPVDFCNLNCGFCPIQAVPHALKEKFAPRFKTGKLKMDWHIFEKIADGLKELGSVERVHFTGGEPLLHPELPRMIAEMKGRVGAKHVAIVSNGIALRGRSDALIEAGLDRLSVSINSVVPKTRRAISPDEPPGYYDKILDGLKELSTKRKNHLPEIALTSVLTRFNYTEARQQVEVAQAVNAGSVTFIPLMAFEYAGHVSTKDLSVNPKQFSKFLKDLDNIQDEAMKAGVWVGYAGNRDHGGMLKTDNKPGAPCYTGFTFATFWPDGSVRPCCNCEESMGNIFRQTLSQIWHGEKYARFRVEMLQPGDTTAGCSCHECGYTFENKEIFTRLKNG